MQIGVPSVTPFSMPETILTLFFTKKKNYRSSTAKSLSNKISTLV
jgi:hypothetical protein